MCTCKNTLTHTLTHKYTHAHKCAVGIYEIAEPDASAAMYPASRLPFQTANIQLGNYKAKYWENKIVTFVS